MNETPAYLKYEKSTTRYNILFIVVVSTSLAAVIIFGALGLALGGANAFSPLFYGMIAGAVVYAAVGLPLCFFVRKRRAIIARYNAYSKVLMRNPHNSVAEISEVCGVDPAVVAGDIDMMNRLGFFKALSVDLENCRVDVGGDDRERGKFVCPVCGGVSEESDEGEDVCAFCGAIKEKENK